MPTKKVIRKPVEKLSYKEEVVEIVESDSDSDSDTDSEEIVIAPKKAPAKKPPAKKERTAAQKAATARMLAAKSKKKEVDINMDTTLYNGEPVQKTHPPPPLPPIADEDDKPLTVRQYKAFMKAKEENRTPLAPKRKYTRKPKAEPAPAPTPSPSPIQQKPTIIFV